MIRFVKASLCLFTIFFISFKVQGQEKQKPQYLLEPSDWGFEHIDFPLDFAPNISYEGFEELRFAPGMFDPSSEDYFTYAFVLALKNQNRISKKEIIDFLHAYYKGLSRSVAKSKNQEVDVSKIQVTEKRWVKEGSRKVLLVKMSFLDTFSDGREIPLFLEIELIPQNSKNHLLLFALASTFSDKDSETWASLYEIRKKLNYNLFIK
ncbi:hypothetical protein [Xanthovirga aplysinae]|uniref:hypothetical protein n=1 Tax=Xanthovirga aplysinae TaxID=2529853 RepID=UPI0012BCA43C|nr:hypothetical protein [Xanthovirga aplysinae]MTI31616.1 hypothetical protein [Xanthovirga aplysinae]